MDKKASLYKILHVKQMPALQRTKSASFTIEFPHRTTSIKVPKLLVVDIEEKWSYSNFTYLSFFINFTFLCWLVAFGRRLNSPSLRGSEFYKRCVQVWSSVLYNQCWWKCTGARASRGGYVDIKDHILNKYMKITSNPFKTI